MQLNPPNRREVIEDLLDIRIFSTMNGILKERCKGIRENIREVEYQFELAKNKVETQQALIDHLKEQSNANTCLLYTSPSPRDKRQSRMPSSA